MTYTPISTFMHVLSERPWEYSVSWRRIACRMYQPWFRLVSTFLNCLQWSKSRRSTRLRAKHIDQSKLRFVMSKPVLSKKWPSFQCYNSPVDTRLITISRYWISITQHHHIPMWELDCTRWNTKVHHLVSILHTTALLKVVLLFDFVNTSGQKLSTLHAHFTHPYWALVTSLTSITIAKFWIKKE